MTVILIHVPSAAGVYAIWREETCLYVGEAKDLLSRLVWHHQNMPAVAGEQPTWFWFETSEWGIVDRIARRDALIAELKPTLNAGAG
jgi:hypothetical protein